MDELEKKLNAYGEEFGDSFPTYPLCLTRTDEEVIKIIDKCLEKKKDVYELGYLSDDMNIKY